MRGFKYVLVAPVVFVLAFFSLYPFVFNIYLSFTDASIYNYLSPNWVMLENYYDLLISSGYFWDTLRITVTYVLIVVAIEFLLGLGYALLVNGIGRMQRVVVTILMLPMALAPVFVGALGRLLFHGLVGTIPYYMKLIGLPPPSLSNPVHALLIVAIMDIWQWTPFMFIIFLAGLKSLPQSVIDAAKVDGASGFNEFRYVIFPLLKDVMMVALVFRIMDAFKTFDVPYMLIEGGPGAPVGATTTVSILIYKFAMTYIKFGEGAALTVLLSVVMGVLASVLLKYLLREQHG